MQVLAEDEGAWQPLRGASALLSWPALVPSLLGSAFCPCTCSHPLPTKICTQHKQGSPSFLLSKRHVNTAASISKLLLQPLNDASVSRSLVCEREGAVAAVSALNRETGVASETQPGDRNTTRIQELAKCLSSVSGQGVQSMAMSFPGKKAISVKVRSTVAQKSL